MQSGQSRLRILPSLPNSGRDTRAGTEACCFDFRRGDMQNEQLLPLSVGFLTGRFSSLLVALFLLFLLHTVLPDHSLTHYSLPAFLLVTLLTSIYAFGGHRRVSLVAGVLGFAAVVLRWATYVSEEHVLLLISDGVGALFFAFTSVVILVAVLRDQAVTGDTISGALCVYFLMGLTWAFLFMVVESVHPGSFRIGEGVTLAVDPAHPYSALLSLFLYFSLGMLSTAGFGDIVPLTGPARGLATLEGILGQFYMAVLVARLVGLYSARSQR